MSARRASACLAFAIGILACLPAFSGVRTLEWNPSVGATGYRVHYGDVTGAYDITIDVTTEIEFTSAGTIRYTTDQSLDDCTTWYFAVTAYNGAGESGFSNEVPWLTPLGISSVAPVDPVDEYVQGVQFDLKLVGAGFADGATITVDHPHWNCPSYATTQECDDLLDDLRQTVRLEAPSINCNEIRLWATIEPVTPGALAAFSGEDSGLYTVTVENPDGSREFLQLFNENIATNRERFDVNRSIPSTVDRLDGADVIWLSSLHDTCNWPGTAEQPCCAPGTSGPQLDACRQARAGYLADFDFGGNGWVDGTDLARLGGSNFGACWDGDSWAGSACD